VGEGREIEKYHGLLGTGYALAVLDAVHKLTLRAVARGDAGESPALRTLVASGLVEQHPDGGHVVTAAGRVALKDDDESGFAATFSEVTWGIAVAPFSALVILFAVLNSSRGDALLTETQIVSLLIVGVGFGLAVAYAKRAAR
jgi:hypothetical protein